MTIEAKDKAGFNVIFLSLCHMAQMRSLKDPDPAEAFLAILQELASSRLNQRQIGMTREVAKEGREMALDNPTKELWDELNALVNS